jgi:BA14K-like protein
MLQLTVPPMSTLRRLIVVAIVLAIVFAIFLASAGRTPLLAQDLRAVSSRGIWYFDGRDDDRDFPTNGFFPGDFAANPSGAWLGAAGIFGSNPSHAANGYPGIVGAEQPGLNWCARRYRSYDRASGTFLGNDGIRHRC